MPFCHAELRVSKPKSSQYPKEINTLGDHICTRRLDLKLLQRQVGDRIGVDGTTITNWELNATTPAIRNIPAIVQFLGYDPLQQTGEYCPFPERLATARKALGLSQRSMAEVLGVDQGTLQGWECGRHQPTAKTLQSINKVLGWT